MCAPPKFPARKLAHALLVVASGVVSQAAFAQALTPHPENWRPIVYRDLQIPGPEDRVFVDLWADLIQSNNRRYIAAGDRRYALSNAPAREAHVVVRGGDRSALLSILDTATNCAVVVEDPATKTSVKICPMRLALWIGAQPIIREAKGCYLEPRSAGAFTSDPSYAASYASYDVATKSIRLGVILAHRAVERCAQTVPLYPK